MKTWKLDSKHSGVLFHLQNKYLHRTDSRLFIFEFNDILYRNHIIDWFRQTPVIVDQIPMRTGALVLDDNISDFEKFKDQLLSYAGKYHVLHVLNLELWLANLNMRNDLFKGFHYYCDVFKKHCPFALILWMTEADIKCLAKKAPDLWQSRTIVYDFSWRIEQVKTRTIEIGVIENMSPRIVREQIKKIRSDMKSLPSLLCEDAAICQQNIGELYRNIGNNKNALSAFKEAKSIFETIDDKRRSHLTLRSMIDIKASLEITEETFTDYINILRTFEILCDEQEQIETIKSIISCLKKRNSIGDHWKAEKLSNLIDPEASESMIPTTLYVQEILMNTYKLRLLHISDLHERGPAESEIWRRRRVLGNHWLENLEHLKTKGPFDLVCFTGDIAHSGQEHEYAAATEFLQETLKILDVPFERLFLVPGNHDICQTTEKDNWEKVRETLDRLDDQDLSRWLANLSTPLGLQDTQREALLARQIAYRNWLKNDLKRVDLLPNPAIHPHLGYRQTVSLSGLPFAIHIIGLDSAWLAGDDNDAGKLRLTEDQVMRLTSDLNGEALDGLRLVLIHHPLTELADRVRCQRLLAERVDLLLRGHLHEPEPAEWADPERRLRQVAAGCLYEGQKADRYPNACEVIEIDLDDKGRPQQYNLWFRGWSEKGFWFDDNSLYRQTREGRLDWKV